MKVILSMAISANGIIATKTGGEDFVSLDNWHQFVKRAKKVGCFIWGRKTYEAVSKWEGDLLNDVKDVRKIIISSSEIALVPGFSLATSPAHALALLEAESFKEAIVTGGAITNSNFAKSGLIDEVVLDVNPYLLGNGIPLFSVADFELKLDLIGVVRVGKQIVELKYRVDK
jgi:dihydrofolate reductase